MTTRITNAEEFGIHTVVNKEKRTFTVTVNFADDRLPYYPVSVAAIIACRAPTTMYKALSKNVHGLEAVTVEGVVHITHDSLVNYLKERELTKDAMLARKAETVKKIVRKPVSHGPQPPQPVMASPTAKEIVDSGRMDFLDELVH